jgi:hypothetical protein
MEMAMKFSRSERIATALTLGILIAAVALPGAPPPAGASTNPPLAGPAPAAAPAPNAVQDILKMMDAGVSKDVLIAYIENSPAAPPTVEDIIALKKHLVPDDVTTALVKRSAKVSTPPTAIKVTGASAASARPGPVGYNRLDPEGYDFWWYHYAYPRTLQSANERLYPYSPLYPGPLYHPIPYGPRIGYPGFP